MAVAPYWMLDNLLTLLVHTNKGRDTVTDLVALIKSESTSIYSTSPQTHTHSHTQTHQMRSISVKSNHQ